MAVKLGGSLLSLREPGQEPPGVLWGRRGLPTYGFPRQIQQVRLLLLS